MAGCDYLPNVPGIGMHKAKMIDSSDDFQSDLEKRPANYQQKFQEAKFQEVSTFICMGGHKHPR